MTRCDKFPTNIFVDHKNNRLIIEPFELCSESLKNTIRKSYNLSWEKRKKMIKGKTIDKYFIIAKYRNEVEFNWIMDVIEQELPDYSFDTHDYYEGYLSVEDWLSKRKIK